MKLTLPYPPTLNHLYATVNGRRVLSVAGRRFRVIAGQAAAQAGVGAFVGDVVVTLHFYRPRRGDDLDNRLKAALDSLTGILWHDDSQVCQIHAYRHEDKANPRCEVTIEEVPGG